MNQDPDKPPRKFKYPPKAPPAPSRSQKLKRPAPETVSKNEDGGEEEARELMRQFTEANTRQVPKVTKKASVQIAFDAGAASSTSIRKYGNPKDGDSAKATDSMLEDSTSDDRQIVRSTAREDETFPYSLGASTEKFREDYREPGDYKNTSYPITLPWRKPDCSDPELLDEDEFGEAARNLEYDENTINSAKDLGLLDESQRERMMLFQFPSTLPLFRRSASVKGKEKAESSKILGRVDAPESGCSLKELPGGYMGKMLVYRSGAVKLKLGETIFDVSPGSDCSFSQDVAAINTKDGNFCVLGEVDKRVVVTPGIDSMFDKVVNLGEPKKDAGATDDSED
ncbi:DNA-directed RNA polymerase III subunit RPC4-like isoform X2 [Mangifera indica]|uniref:DNA-directed RNA polymerase III subunit RPC4-like isoform X2 n=1 Tax=Mangifera indica TaxID=29780 RepID=UPI001CF93049|nr:DNA-directed RNA polymerase III subunit RPC4-like isoform X2 [Mangifera indica]